MMYEVKINPWPGEPGYGYAAKDRLEWCREHFGKTSRNNKIRWGTWGSTIQFMDEKDYAWYMLRWS